jgi:hypothetical protein
MAQVEIFTPLGVVSGATLRPTLGVDDRGAPIAIPVERGRWYPLDGSKPEHQGSMIVAPDDVLLIVTAPPDFTVHASWYPIEIDVGPYCVEGRLPTSPGFDPARALARPGGAFVAIRDVVIKLRGRPDAGVAERSFAHVNRYAVDRVASTLMLGFFFPGASLDPLREAAPV